MTPLHHLGETLRAVLMNVPLTWVRGLFLVTLLAILVWVLSLPRAATTPPDGAKRWDENLKTGAALALGIQLLVYLLL